MKRMLINATQAEERRLAPTRIEQVRYNAVGYSMAALMPAGGVAAVRNGSAIYRGFPTLLAPHLRLVFDRVLNERGALAYNCSAGQDRKKAALMGDAWKGWAQRTSFWPFGLQLSGRAPVSTIWPGLTVVLLGIVIWLGVTYVHPMLGAPVAGVWIWL